MPKILKPVRMERCIGCGLCELAAARAAKGKLSYSGSFLQIRRASSGQPFFKAMIDYGQRTDYKEVRDICPENCYDIE
uniref:4Fe-4S ferredoxin-type domain-containing protein n=1 Tax=candidate division WWE3 bacterium TaxID=2053526 RepID=A0A831YZZ7_UNCKA